MEKKNILILGIYLLTTIICLFYFFNTAITYERINSISTFIAYPVTLLLALSFFIYRLVLTDRIQYIFSLTISFLLLLGAVCLLFELIKPEYTYVQAQKLIEEEYSVKIIDSEQRVLLDGVSTKEIYKISAHENSKKVEFSFNPYTKDI